MAGDRAGNSLRKARPFQLGNTVRDTVGSRDRDDIYRIRLESRSQFSVSLTSKTKLKAELFTLKQGAIGRIGKIEFSNLNRQQIRQNLTRIVANARSIDPVRASSSSTTSRTLDRGDYYLRISAQRGNKRYRLTVNATPSASSPSPSPDPTPTAVTLTRSWLQQFGTSGNDYVYGTAVDSSGNVYVAGRTPNPTMTSTTDAFVAKYSASGRQEWLRQFGSEQNSDTAFDVAVDAQGNYYVVGATNINTSIATANSDGFIAKFAPNGDQLWPGTIDSTVSGFPFGRRSGLDAASGIAIDAAGNAYVSGFTAAFPTSSDQSKAFVAKYSTIGAREWLTEYGSTAADAAADVALDAAGNVYITGIRNADLTANADEPFSGGDAFVAKFNNGDGLQQWEKFLGAVNGQTYGRSIAVTSDGTIYIAGQTDGTLAGQTSAGGRDGFIARYSFDGTPLWAKQLGTTRLDEVQGVAIAPDGSIYATGETSAALFGQPSGGSDAWFAQFAPSGDRLSAQQFGTIEDDESYNLRFDSGGNLYVIGQTLGTFSGQNRAGAYDAWIAKYTP